MREMMDETGEKLIDTKVAGKIDKMKRDGKISQAIEICRSALKQDPMNPELHVRLGDLYMEKQQDISYSQQFVDDAVNEYRRALESDLKSAEIHYKLAQAFFIKGDLEKAKTHASISLEYDSQNYKTLYLMAKIFIRQNRIIEAENFLKDSIKYGKFKSARSYYLQYKLLKLKSNKDKNVFVNKLYSFAMSVLVLPFDKDAGKAVIKKLSFAKFIPIFVKGYYFEKTKDVYQAIDLYINSIEKTPGFIPLYIQLGNAYRMVGRINDAVNEYKMAIWLEPTNIVAYKLLCSLYEEQGDYEKAINIYNKLIEMHPQDAVLYSNLANIYYLKGDLKEAIHNYQAAISLNPNNNWTSVIAQTLGYIYQESKENYDAAISAYQSASMLNPRDIDIYISLGSAFYDKGDFKNALATYRLALEVDPNNARIHCNLGFLLWNKGDIEEAVKEYQSAISLDPEYDIAYNNLGVIFLDDLGYVDKAIECLRNAVQCNCSYALAHYNLGRALALQGDNIEAARLLQVSLDLNAHTNELDSNEIRMKINELFE